MDRCVPGFWLTLQRTRRLTLPSRSFQWWRKTGKNFHCDVEALPAVLCCWLCSEGSLPSWSSSHNAWPCWRGTEPKAINHQRLSEEGWPSPHPQEKCALGGGAVSMDVMMMDGPRKAFFTSEWYTCAFSLWGQVLTGTPAVLCFLSCCHLFPLTDKWTHFAAWMTHDCFRKRRLSRCGKGGKWRWLFLTWHLKPPSSS